MADQRAGGALLPRVSPGENINLWQFAQRLRPQACNLALRWATSKSLSAASVQRAKREAQQIALWAEPSDWPLLFAEAQQRRLALRAGLWRHLMTAAIPESVRKALASGQYRVTALSQDGRSVRLSGNALAALQPQLHGNRLTGDGAGYGQVRISGIAAAPKARPLSDAALRERLIAYCTERANRGDPATEREAMAAVGKVSRQRWRVLWAQVPQGAKRGRGIRKGTTPRTKSAASKYAGN